MPTAPLPNVDIYYEEHGPSDGDVILLVMGLGSQLVYWPPGLVNRLTDAGLRVITFDNRDVGRSGDGSTRRSDLRRILASSVGVPVPEPPYTLADMAADAVGLLDHLGVDRAHVLGVSMGGMIAQRIAIHHPDRVITLTSIMSSPGDRLSGLLVKPRGVKTIFARPSITDRESFVEAVSETRRMLRGTLPGDDAFMREAVGKSYDRGLNAAGFVRQLHAVRADGDRRPLLRGLDVPALVVHGTEDPLVNVLAGKRTAKTIPGARLKLIEGMGHDLPPVAQDIIADEVLRLVKDSAGDRS